MAATTTVDTPFGTFECFEGDTITRQLQAHGVHQGSDLGAVLSLVRAGDHVVDVGAHVGTFAVPLARAVGPGGRVWAFEPVPEHFALLERNVAANGLAGTVVPVAALVATGEAARSVRHVPGNTGAASFAVADGEPPAGDQAGAPLHMSLDRWWRTEAGAGHVDLVKVDVEGMEAEVLESGAALVDAERPVVVFEVLRSASGAAAMAALDRFFSSRGYHVFVNLADRNAPPDRFRFGRLAAVAPGRLPGVAIIDVVAVHPDSPRYPAALAPWATQLVLAARVAGHAARRPERALRRFAWYRREAWRRRRQTKARKKSGSATSLS